jgi:hypothetical protein
MAIRIINNNYGGRVSISSRGLGGRFQYAADPVRLLLNDYPGAAAAYSLRKLNNAYAGSAVRVRRSSDNTEQDIGFVLGQLDTTSLSTFVGTQNNLIPYSEDFTQWSLFNSATVNTNATTDPIGGNTADRLNFATSALSQIFYPQSTLTNSVTYVISVYAKSDTKSKFRFKVSDGTTEVFSPDITTTSSWVRYDYTISSAPISNNVAIVNESAGGAGAIFIWGAQLNIRTLQTYTQTIGTAKNNDGFVTKWYDQSGNVRDAIQATTANQPRIIYGGSITYINGKPTVENIANSYLATTQTAFTTLQTHSDFIVTKALTQTQPNDYVGYLVFGPLSGNDFDSTSATTINTGQISTGKNLMLQGSGYSIIGSGLITLHRLITHIINAQSGQAYSNNVSVGTSTGTFSTMNGGSLYIGVRYVSGLVNTSYSYLGFFQEIITYNTNQTSNRTAIESNINSYYSIY